MRIILFGTLYALVIVSAAQRRPPNYSLDEMPRTSFSCRDKIVGGYYADPETDCQMFHVCVRVAGLGVQDFRFLCPNDTSFDQENQICDDWYNIDCEASTLYYSDNFDLYRIADGVPEFGPSRATPISLGPSSIAPLPYNKPKRPHTPVNNAVSEDDDDSYLFKADTGDRRLHKDLLRGSSSGNFFANKNHGKEDNEYEDIATHDSTKNQLDTQSKKKQNKGVVRKLLTGKRPLQTQEITTTTTTTTIAPNPYNNIGARNKYNTVQRNRPTTPASTESVANNYYQSTAAPANNYNNYNSRNNYNANAFNNYQTSTVVPSTGTYNNFKSRGNVNFNAYTNKQPETTVNYYNQQSTTISPAQNYNNNNNNNYQYNNNYNTNQYQTTSTANPFNNYYQPTNGQTTKLQNYQPTTNGNNYYQQQQQTQSTVNYYNQQYNTNKSPTTDVYQQPSTTVKPFSNNNNYFQQQQTTSTVKPLNNNYYQQQSTVTTAKPTVNNNYYNQQNYNNQQPSTTTFNYDYYYQTSTTNSPANYPNYYTTQATPFVNSYDQGSSTTQNSNYQTKNLYNFNVNAANAAAAHASATNSAASFTNSQQNYDPYNSYHNNNNNDKYDEPTYGESLKTAPSSNIKPSDINSLSQQTYQAQKTQNKLQNNGFNTTVSASYNFNTESQKIQSASQKFQTTKSLQTTLKPNYYTVAVPTSKAINRNTQVSQQNNNYQNQFVSSSQSSINRGNNFYTTAPPSAAIVQESKKSVPQQQSTTIKSTSTKTGASKSEKDTSYDYAYYDDGSPSEYDAFDPVGEEFSKTHSKKSKRGTIKQK